LLNSVKIFVDSVDGDDYTICTEVSSLIRKITKLIEGISEKCSGIFNTCKYLNQIADLLLKYPKTESAMFLKELIKSKIQYFIDRRVKKIEIDNIPENLIEEKDTILFLGKSKIFRKLLLKAKNKNINFKVIFADSPKRNQISSEIEYLSKLGIPVVYTYIKEVTNLMSNVTKVFIKGDSMLVNGYLLGKSGTSLLALIAKYFNKPIYVFCPSFKFMNKIILNNNTDYKKMGPNLCEVNFDYDVTPSPYIETVVCENGYLHSSSIPVYIRELEENDDDSININ
jgi:translation initiation factor eIF-2B subunit delta